MPFHDAFLAVRLPPETFPVAFHMLTLLPVHGIEMVQPLIGLDPVFVMVMSTLRPVFHSDVTFTATVIAAGVLAEPSPDAVAGIGEAIGEEVGTFAEATAPLDVVEMTEQVPLGIVHVVGMSPEPRD